MFAHSVRTTLFSAALLSAIAFSAAPAAAQKSYETVSFQEKFGYAPQSSVRTITNTGTVLTDNSLLDKGGLVGLPQLDGFAATQYNAVNVSGTAAGLAVTMDFSEGVGFVRKSNGTVTYLNVPGSSYVEPLAINGRGDVVGYCFDESFNLIGFIADKSGVRPFSVPGSVATYLVGINSSGVILGVYFDQSFASHSFTLDNKGIHEFVMPGAVYVEVSCINDHGEIGGIYSTDQINFYGFVYDRGRVSTVDHKIPNAVDQLIIDFGEGPWVFNKVQESSSVSSLNAKGELLGNAAALYFPEDPNVPFLLLMFESYYGAPVP